MLVSLHGWSLYDIDRTDMESLLAFVVRKSGRESRVKTRLATCDQVNWL